MTAIFRRELHTYFKGLWAYIFAAFLLLFTGIYTVVLNLGTGYPYFEYALDGSTFVFLIVIPMLTMRIISEERRQKTDQLLYSLPLSMTQVVMGKYLALLVVMAMPFAVLSTYPLILAQYGRIPMISAYGSLLALFLLAATLAAVGTFISSITESQAAAAGLCFAAVLVLYFANTLAGNISSTAFASLIGFFIIVVIVGAVVFFMTKSSVAALGTAFAGELVLLAIYRLRPSMLEGLFPELIKKLSVFSRFYTFADGVFDITALVYFVTVTGVFLFLAVQSLEKRRWVG